MAEKDVYDIEMNEETRNFRLDHLINFVQRTFGNAAYDEIARQMEKHEISAPYGPDRIVEIFENVLVKEREEMINDCSMDLEAARSERRSMLEKLKERQEAGEREVDVECARNLKIRREINALETLIYNKEWKLQKIRFHNKARNKRMLAVLDEKLPFLGKMAKQAKELNSLGSSVKNEIESVGSSLKKLIEDVKTEVRDLIKENSSSSEKTTMPDDSDRKIKHLEAQKKTNDEIRAALNDLLSHINSLEKEIDVKLDLENVTETSTSQSLQSAVKRARTKGGHNTDWKAGAETQAKIDEGIRAIEKEFVPQFMKQKSSMRRLQKELTEAKGRLAALRKAQQTVDPTVMTMLERSKKQMEPTQAKTDALMKQLQDHSYSSLDSFI